MSTAKLVFKKTLGLIAWPCIINVPLPENGGHQKQEITARFKIISQAEIDGFYAPSSPVRMAGNADVELLKLALDGFDGFKDETGAAVPDDVAKEWALATPYVIDGLARGYFEMLGRRLKN